MSDGILKNNDLVLRKGEPADHIKIMSVMKEWWGGRDLTSLLLKQFFYHFRNTILVVEDQEGLIGFVMGYFSQTQPKEAYIHVVAVNPNTRKTGVGRFLYENFFVLCKENGRTIIRACTAPININSIEFHTHMGFTIEQGNATVNGFPVTLDYLGKDDHKVLFVKELT